MGWQCAGHGLLLHGALILRDYSKRQVTKVTEFESEAQRVGYCADGKIASRYRHFLTSLIKIVPWANRFDSSNLNYTPLTHM